MKYLWLNQHGIGTLNMQTSGDYIRGKYNIKMMDNQQQDSSKKVKRFRSAFTTDQVNYLEKQFKKFPYIGNAHRKEVALTLNIPERAVKIWFQNRRMKEKKESTTKEFDDEQDIRKSFEFAKDQLNNVRPSTNELRSLPLLTDMSQTTGEKNLITNKSKFNILPQLIEDADMKDSGEKNTCPVPQNVVTTTKVIHPPSVFVKMSQSPSHYKTSVDFSIDQCKKYKPESFDKSNVTQPLKKEAVDMKNIETKCIKPVEQMKPEDLSPNRKMNISAMAPQQALPGNASNNSGYVSLVPTVSPFYTQPYISASGVIWKPLNVMPVVPSSSSTISSPSNPLLNMSTVQENVPKRCCSCDCHVKQVIPQVPYNFPQQSPSPQYIITAVPFQHSSTKY